MNVIGNHDKPFSDSATLVIRLSQVDSFYLAFLQEYLIGTPKAFMAADMGEPALKSFFLEPYVRIVMSKVVVTRVCEGATIKALMRTRQQSDARRSAKTLISR